MPLAEAFPPSSPPSPPLLSLHLRCAAPMALLKYGLTSIQTPSYSFLLPPGGSHTIPRGISSPLSSFPFSLFCLPPTFDLSPHTAISAGSTSLWSIDYWTASSTIYPSLCVRGLRSCSYVPSTNGLRCWMAPVGRLCERKLEVQSTTSLGSTQWFARPTIDPSLHAILTQIFSSFY